jgi:DNA polymerase I-like protein with 3'-5' exonuclease and polymerase domains
MALSSLPKSSATVGTVVQMIEAADVVALDLETTGLDPRRSEIRLVQVSNGEKTYLIDLFTVGEARAIFEALARDDLTVIAHGAAFEYGFVYAKYGIALDNLRDTLLLARLAACGDVRLECSLEAVAERELGISLDKTLQSADWSGELTLEHLRYAAEDARVLLSLYHSLSKKILETGQDRVSEIEHDALPAVSRMRLEGMPVDKAAWDAHAKEVVTELRALKAEMLSAEWMPERDPIPQTWTLQGPECLEMLYAAGLEGVTGTTAKDLADHADNPLVEALLAYRKAKGEERDRLRAHVLELAPDRPPALAPPWNFGSPQQVKELAYKILGFNLKSTNEATLLEFVSWHPLIKYLLKYRELSKRMGTYGPGWFKGAYDEETGRVYPSWQQIGTSTGRFSCSSPNAQNIPNDGPYRSFFRAPSGRIFVDVDYSQIEVRIYGRLVGETALLGLFDRGDADVYRATAANLLGITEEEVTKEERQKAKAIMLGLLYGLSARGLPAYAFKNYGVTIEPKEAEALIERFFEFYPAIASDHASVLFELESTGYIDRKTLTGRCRDNITVRNEAINMPIQGTAADGLKIAIGRVYEELKKFDGTAFIIAALHDELLVECNEADAPEIEDIVAEAMLEAMNELLNASEPRVELEVSGGRARVWTKD